MTVTLELRCGGCDERATVGPLRKRFHGTRGDWGLGVPRVDPVEDLAPDGWVMFDPYTYCTYCPTCWASIVAEPAEVSA